MNRKSRLFPVVVGLVYYGLSIWLFHGRVFPPVRMRLGEFSESGVIIPWLCALPFLHSQQTGREISPH